MILANKQACCHTNITLWFKIYSFNNFVIHNIFVSVVAFLYSRPEITRTCLCAFWLTYQPHPSIYSHYLSLTLRLKILLRSCFMCFYYSFIYTSIISYISVIVATSDKMSCFIKEEWHYVHTIFSFLADLVRGSELISTHWLPVTNTGQRRLQMVLGYVASFLLHVWV